MNKLKLSACIAVASATMLPVAARDMKVTVPVEHDWWWNAPEKPSMTILVTDTLGNAGNSNMRFTLATDREPSRYLADFTQTVNVAAGDTARLTIMPPISEPGFYTVTLWDDGKEAAKVNIGYEPENVVSLPDYQPDFNEFWAQALQELEAVAPEYKMTELKEKSGKKRKIYLCEYLSLEGDTVKGYLAMPVKPGKYPAHIYYNGYGAGAWEFDADGRPDWIEYLQFGRGQGLNTPYNRFGDWLQWNLDDPATYYYKGAYMDCVRTIDFIEQLEKTDKDNIFAEGGSQGGAFTLAAAALDPKHRLKAIAPYVPFLSDFPDYFKVAYWPGVTYLARAKELGMSEEQLYRNLSYFDIKNLARRIDIPVLMGVGLQDPTCPPHINFSSFNLIDSEKEFVIYPECGHTVIYDDWNPRRENFFKKYLKD